MKDIDGAMLSLDGLSTGDAFGELFFSIPLMPPGARTLPPPEWRWTDDTHMALSIVDVLARCGRIDRDVLAAAFAGRYVQEPWRGYGGGARRLLRELSRGGDWKTLSPALFGGGSYGNGGAMRAAPIGGFFGGEPARAAEEARHSAMVTHAHEEGQAGAMAVAAAASLAAGDDCPKGREFIREVAAFTPSGETCSGIEASLSVDGEDLRSAVQLLGTGERVSAQDTVPFCIWCAAYHLEDFEEAMWWTVSGQGDRDTTCAIVGGIVALSSRGIPEAWLRRREPLPEGFGRRRREH
ncbi:MAG: ADP-ribosylglycohydrolase family protein [Syntrophobacteraceae bacterium]|nr:ADP-ribosylglycohydrolase family protein [Desulfobacteraceae bacterium]